MTIEQKTADAVLQTQATINVCGTEYKVGAPTLATLIMVSGLVSRLPEMHPDSSHVLEFSLKNAKDTEVIGHIAAVLILGAKRVKENRKIRTGLFTRINEVDYIAQKILDEYEIKELVALIAGRLNEMQIADFFVLTSSLNAANLLKPTKGEGTTSGD